MPMERMSHEKRRARSGHRPRCQARRGMALLDAIIGAIILGIGLGVVLSMTGRSMAAQASGERHLTASWLADELLTMVMIEGPEDYPRNFETAGNFTGPYSKFSYEVDIDSPAEGFPYEVSAEVSWSNDPADRVRVETVIAVRRDEDPLESRIPYEPVDRYGRWYPEDDA